jgi:hypothetical protein
MTFRTIFEDKLLASLFENSTIEMATPEYSPGRPIYQEAAEDDPSLIRVSGS